MTFIFLLILYLLMAHPTVVAQEVVVATQLWFTTLVPTMFPSFVFIDMLERMPFVQRLSRFLFPFFRLLFNINSPKSAFIILLSFLCGAPASTKIIQTSYENKELSKREYQNLICTFSTLSMPYTIFILTQNGLSLWLYYVLFLVLAILWMKVMNRKEEKNTSYEAYSSSYLKYFFQSIQKNTTILFNILGILIIFRVLLGLIFKNEPIFYPYFEILGGLNATHNKIIIFSSMGFLGFSLHLQILSLTDDLKYGQFLFSRIYFSLLGILGFF